MGQPTKKRPNGRPTKYNRAILNTTQDYIENYEESYGDKIPSVAGLAHALELTRETVIQWMNDESKPDFSYMCSRLQSSQERKLLNNGLDGTYNSNITKLVLSKHGYTDSENKQGLSVNVTINRGATEVEVSDNSLTIDHD